MKNYLVFSGDVYYASGGFNDFHSGHDTLEEAIEVAKSLGPVDNKPGGGQWSHVVSIQEMEIVFETGSAYT